MRHITIEGDIHAVEIRCGWRRVMTTPEAKNAWRIPEYWGECGLYVVGQSGTKFEVVEYALDAPG